MANLNTTDVRVFPTSKRVGADPAAKYTTEYNLTNLVNRLTNREAFVITNKVNPGTNIISDFQFNILGYYFTVNLDFTNTDLKPSEPEENNYLYLNATILVLRRDYGDIYDSDTDSEFKNFWNLLGADIDGEFEGLDLKWESVTTHKKIDVNNDNVKINTSMPELSGVYKVHDGFISSYTFTILEYDGENYYIPPASKIRLFTSTDGTHRGVSIDDGILE